MYNKSTGLTFGRDKKGDINLESWALHNSEGMLSCCLRKKCNCRGDERGQDGSGSALVHLCVCMTHQAWTREPAIYNSQPNYFGFFTKSQPVPGTNGRFVPRVPSCRSLQAESHIFFYSCSDLKHHYPCSHLVQLHNCQHEGRSVKSWFPQTFFKSALLFAGTAHTAGWRLLQLLPKPNLMVFACFLWKEVLRIL